MDRRKKSSTPRSLSEACELISRLEEKLRRERARRLAAQRLATHDVLTRLLNRRAFDKEGAPRFMRALHGGNSVALMFIDVNAFKAINDTHGHQVGDLVLIALASALKKSKRPTDLAARKGGDEFVLYFDGLDEAGAKSVCERMHRAVAAIRLKSMPNLRVSISIGVVVGVPHASTTWTSLIAQADTFMYVAKQSSRTDQLASRIGPIARS
jgi:two-component system chemotaxis family response regulator WspR